MNKNQVVRLLNEANKKTICGANSLEEVHGLSESYYKLERKKDEWTFLFVECEKQDEEENIRKIFSNEKDAITFYYLYELADSYYSQYIYPFKIKNKDTKIGQLECTISNLKEAFDRLGIKESYYNFENIENEHSICLKQIGNDKSQVRFIGKDNKIILKTLELENWSAYSVMYMNVYLLFLLDKHCELLIKNKEIEVPFSDEEYSVFIR